MSKIYLIGHAHLDPVWLWRWQEGFAEIKATFRSALDRMKELIAILQEASKAYYAEDREIMSNFEYDKLYDELVQLEEETGTTLAGSPTVSVGYEAVDELPKETHESPMLSLGKTKDREELKEWLNTKPLPDIKKTVSKFLIYEED